MLPADDDLFPEVSPKLMRLLVSLLALDDEKRDVIVDQLVDAVAKVNRASREAREALVLARRNEMLLFAIARKLDVDPAPALGAERTVTLDAWHSKPSAAAKVV